MGYVQRTPSSATVRSGRSECEEDEAARSQAQLHASVRVSLGRDEATHKALDLAPVEGAQLSGASLRGLDDRLRRSQSLLRVDRAVVPALGGRRPARQCRPHNASLGWVSVSAAPAG